MIGLDATREIVLTPNLVEYMTCLSEEMGNFIRNITRFYFDFHWKQEGVIGCVINDPLAVAYCIDHSLCKGFSAYTTVETAGISLGQTVVDAHDFWKKEKNSHILTETDPYRFMTFFITHIFGADASDVRYVLRQIMVEDAGKRVWMPKDEEDYVEMLKGDVVKMRKITVMQICFLGIATALNVVGANLALLLRLPIYLDSLGTVLSAVMLGPVYGMVPGILSGIISGCTSDVYSFYYIPVQMVVGVMAGVFFQKIRPDSRQFWKVLLTALCFLSCSHCQLSDYSSCFWRHYIIRFQSAGAAFACRRPWNDSQRLCCAGNH